MSVTEQPTTQPGTPTRPNAWLVIGGFVTILLVIFGGLTVAGWLGRRTELQSQTYQESVTSIVVDVDSGDIILSTGPAGTLTVNRRLHWSFHKPTFNEQWDGRALTVHGTCDGAFWPGPDCGVDYTLQVPPGTTVTAHTGSGDIKLQGADGELHLRTGSGDISGTGITSTKIDASTGSGDIELRLAVSPSSVTAHSGSGDIQIVVPAGAAYAVRLRTGSGDTHIGVQQDDTSNRSISADSGSGDIELLTA